MHANEHCASRSAIGRKKVERQRKQWHDGTVFPTAMKHVIKANRIIAASVVLIFLATGIFGVALVWTSVRGFAVDFYVALALFVAFLFLNLLARQRVRRFYSRIERSLTKEPKDDPNEPARFVP